MSDGLIETIIVPGEDSGLMNGEYRQGCCLDRKIPPRRPVFLVGYPGARFRLVHDQMAAMQHDVLAVSAGADGDLLPAPQPAFLAAHVVDPDWEAMIRQGDACAVLLLDAGDASLAEMIADGVAVIDAMRVVIGCVSGTRALIGCPHVLALTGPAEPANATLRRIAAHCGWPPPSGTGAQPDRTVSGSEEQDGLLRDVLAPWLHYVTTGERQRTVWSRSLLRWGDQPEQPAPRVVEMTGMARNLVFGPYLALPPGQWEMRTVLAFSPEAEGARLVLFLRGLDLRLIASYRFVVPCAGLFAVVMNVTVESEREPLEIQLMLEHGAIDGRVGIDTITWTPVAPSGQATEADRLMGERR